MSVPTMWTASAWKSWYAEERATLGERGLSAILERAPDVDLPSRGALVFPHTRLTLSGEQVAAVAKAVVASGADRVLAIGVLHGARVEDRPLVEAARLGDSSAAGRLRSVHGARISDEPYSAEEFSLDGFAAFVDLAARRAGRPPPAILSRYPFLVGDDPGSLPGIDALAKLVESGCALVATADAMHHGVGYGAEPAVARDPTSPETMSWVRSAIAEQTSALAVGDYAGFQRLASLHRSDFRDSGPVLAHLVLRGGANMSGSISFEQRALTLVDYSDVLPAPRPTWVAAALLCVD